MRVNFTIEGTPVGKARPRVTRTVTYTPAKTAHYEDLVRYSALHMKVEVVAFFEVPKSYSRDKKTDCLAGWELPTKKPDADNIGKIVMDGMNPKMKRNKVVHKMMQVVRGVYHDDKQVTTLLVKKRYSEYPRVEVTVERDEGK